MKKTILYSLFLAHSIIFISCSNDKEQISSPLIKSTPKGYATFNGIDNYASIADTVFLNPKNNSFSIATVIRTISSKRMFVVSKHESGGAVCYYLCINPNGGLPGTVFCRIDQNDSSGVFETNFYGNNIVNDGKDHYIVWTIDQQSKIGRLYIDGISDAGNVKMTTFNINPSHDFTIGSIEAYGNNVSNFEGRIYDVKYYAEALDSAAVIQMNNYFHKNNNILILPSNKITADYRFDEGADTVLCDKSGNKLNCIIYGNMDKFWE